MITHVSSVIRPEGSDLIFDHPYNADSALAFCRPGVSWPALISISSVIGMGYLPRGGGRCRNWCRGGAPPPGAPPPPPIRSPARPPSLGGATPKNDSAALIMTGCAGGINVVP